MFQIKIIPLSLIKVQWLTHTPEIYRLKIHREKWEGVFNVRKNNLII
jgi:hypothetical protein